MKTRIIITGLLAVALCFGFGVSVMGEDLEISGFFDVVGNYQTSADDKTSFGLGQAELNLENQIADKVTASVAIAYNNETGGFELREATLEINLFEDENNTITSASVTLIIRSFYTNQALVEIRISNLGRHDSVVEGAVGSL